VSEGVAAGHEPAVPVAWFDGVLGAGIKPSESSARRIHTAKRLRLLRKQAC
jgi:hypothetical protein